MDIQPLNRSTAQPLNRSTAKKAKCKNLTAFTLLELMVVISIVGIFVLIAVPGFKKAYQDFWLQRTLSDADTLLQSCRSYYLIYNEIPPDSQKTYIEKSVACFLPSNFFKKTSGNNYKLLSIPFHDSSCAWDFDNWITWSSGGVGCMYVSANCGSNKNSATINTWLNFFKKHYSWATPQPFHTTVSNSICLPFPEFPLRAKLDRVSKTDIIEGS